MQEALFWLFHRLAAILVGSIGAAACYYALASYFGRKPVWIALSVLGLGLLVQPHIPWLFAIQGLQLAAIVYFYQNPDWLSGAAWALAAVVGGLAPMPMGALAAGLWLFWGVGNGRQLRIRAEALADAWPWAALGLLGAGVGAFCPWKALEFTAPMSYQWPIFVGVGLLALFGCWPLWMLRRPLFWPLFLTNLAAVGWYIGLPSPFPIEPLAWMGFPLAALAERCLPNPHP